jgi:hypothetical protein
LFLFFLLGLFFSNCSFFHWLYNDTSGLTQHLLYKLMYMLSVQKSDF